MNEQQHHEELIDGIAEQWKSILKNSEQAIYIYLDDSHKVCNKRFADLLGYKSTKAWAAIEAPLSDVIEKDQHKVIDAYVNASEKGIAGTLDVRVSHIKTGETIKTRVTMAPIAFSGHVFVAHFISRI